MKRKEIALIKETRQSKFVNKIMDTIAPNLELKPSDKVAIKINLSGFREIYANTHYETVESLIFYLKDHFGISDIAVIEGSDGAFFSGKTTWDIFYKFRYKEVELNGARLVNLDDLEHQETLEVDTLSGKQKVHFTRYEADYIISVVPPKTHNIFPVSLSIPNLVGYVEDKERVLMFGAQRSDMRRINFSNFNRYSQLIDMAGRNFARLLEKIPPSLVLVDGLYGMEGKGPIKGSPVFHGFALASEDPVLADSLTTYVMGFDINDVSYIYHAAKAELGSSRWQNVVGVEPNQVKFPYRPHPLYPRQKNWRNPGNGPNRNSHNRNGQNRKEQNFRKRSGAQNNRFNKNHDRNRNREQGSSR